MKCLICGEKTNNKILCSKHIGVDACLQYLTVHNCSSFKQKKEEAEGICEYNLVCTPIKEALKHKILLSSNLGHVICPHASMNLAKVMYSDLSEDEIRGNYPECLD